jgi:hypothetical protein
MSAKRILTAVLSGALVLALAACGDDGGTAATTSATQPTTSAATTSPSSTRPVAPDLRASGIGSIAFGTPADAAVRDLTTALGKADDDSTVVANMPDGLGGPQTTLRTVRWGKLSVSFIDWKGSPFRADGTLHFVRWIATGAAADVRNLTTPEGVKVGTSVADLKRIHDSSLVIARDECSNSWQVSFDRSNVGLVGRLDANPELSSAKLVYLAAGLRSSC